MSSLPQYLYQSELKQKKKKNSEMISTLCEARSFMSLQATDTAFMIVASWKIQSSTSLVANSPRPINAIIVIWNPEVVTPLTLYSSYVGI